MSVKAQNGGSASLALSDAMELYAKWEAPTVIISDGPYGLGKFPGEPNSPDDIAAWYAPHVAEWSRNALPETTLWFWCSELGWAEVHGLLKAHGWKYKAAHVWDKGVGHVAGNCNSETIRGFPVVTEMCVQYTRETRLLTETGEALSIKAWLRHEWQRSGLPLYRTNDACGVVNAATRKYFTQCHLWYFPPPEKMVALAAYATAHGKATVRPYFSLDGKRPLTAEQWTRMRSKWNHAHGLTNVWQEPAVRGDERIKAAGLKALHANQKPLKLIERIVEASSEKGDVVWEPFGGMCSGAIGAMRTGRRCFASEVNPDFFNVAAARITAAAKDNQVNVQSDLFDARPGRAGRKLAAS